MRNMLKALLTLVVLSLLGCGAATSSSGVLVGFVVNGQTGEKVNFYDSNNLTDKTDSQSQIYTIIGGTFVRATPCGTGFITTADGVTGDGCYKITGIPDGAELPIFAVKDGMEKFHGVYVYPDAVVDDKGVAHSHPQMVGNIRMFPKNYTVDYKLLANFNGRGINGVTVACQIRQDTVALATDGTHWIAPANTLSGTLTGQTGNDGVLGDGYYTVKGTDMVLGARYHCTAFMPAGLYNSVGALTGTADFTAGVDAPELGIDLSEAKTSDPDLLYAVDSNADDASTLMGASAKLIINFNRPVEIVPGSADCQTYSITSPDTNGDANPMPQPPADVPLTGGSEQVTISSSNNDQTLTIAFKTPTNPFDTKDLGSSVTFRGIYVRPKASQVDGNIFRRIGQAASNGCSAGGYLGFAALPLKNARTGTQAATIFLY